MKEIYQVIFIGITLFVLYWFIQGVLKATGYGDGK